MIGSTPTVTDEQIARWRLEGQRLAGRPAATAADVVSGLLAVQAENPAQASWAVATRTTDLTASAFSTLFDEGVVLRTHVLRPTWHFVHPDDIRWLIELTGPRVQGSIRGQRRALGLDEQALEAATSVIEDSLSGGIHLTREALAARLRDAGCPTEGGRFNLVAVHAEITGLICSGAMQDGRHTYALLDERAPRARRLDRDEALAELALGYFTGHGPATERDLAYWASLTLTDVRAGIEAVAEQLGSFEHDGRTFWFGQPAPTVTAEPRGHLLQILDEYYRGYQDSRWVLDTRGLASRGREASTGMVLVGGQFVGGMRRTTGANEVTFELELRRSLEDDEMAAIQEAADRYGRFLDLEPKITTKAEP